MTRVKSKQSAIIIITAVLLAVMQGCAPVKPWEREYLARSHMAFDPDPLEARSKQHVYFSKEASSGGYGIGGGGCGCN